MMAPVVDAHHGTCVDVDALPVHIGRAVATLVRNISPFRSQIVARYEGEIADVGWQRTALYKRGKYIKLRREGSRTISVLFHRSAGFSCNRFRNHSAPSNTATVPSVISTYVQLVCSWQWVSDELHNKKNGKYSICIVRELRTYFGCARKLPHRLGAFLSIFIATAFASRTLSHT